MCKVIQRQDVNTCLRVKDIAIDYSFRHMHGKTVYVMIRLASDGLVFILDPGTGRFQIPMDPETSVLRVGGVFYEDGAR